MKSESRKPQRLLRIAEVMTIVGIGKSSIYDGVQQGTFPQPIKLSARAVCWPESEISAWVNARISGEKTSYTPKKACSRTPQEKSLRLTSCTMHFQTINGQPEIVVEHGGQDGPAYIAGKDEILSASKFLQRCARACQ